VTIFIAATIRATCEFDAKKRLILPTLFELSYCGKNSKTFFKFSDFILRLPAVLIEMPALLFLSQVMTKSNLSKKSQNGNLSQYAGICADYLHRPIQSPPPKSSGRRWHLRLH